MRRAACALLVLIASAARAHEIGTTRVRIALMGDHTWRAEITTAPQSLVNKLEAVAHEPRNTSLDANALRREIDRLRLFLANQTDVRFDGVRSAPSISIADLQAPTDAALPAYVIVRAEGAIPARSRALTWQLGLAYSTYALTIETERGASRTEWIEGGGRSSPFPLSAAVAPATRADVIRQYLKLGFLHIVPYGFDHILFVLGIFLLTTHVRPILTQVTAFTIAHSITLGLTMYGIVSLSPRVVEPAIAVSIVYVALENIATTELKPWRPAVVFAFGLLHGMGFAGVLKSLGLPRSQFVPALISFNCGVEAAQLTVIAVAFLLIALWHRRKPWYRIRFVIPASLAIAATGLFWTVERLVT